MSGPADNRGVNTRALEELFEKVCNRLSYLLMMNLNESI